ncbi:MAG: DUF6502 family protein [Candidatus Binatia bacterium]
MSLARAVTADLAPQVLLDELLRSGAAELREGDVVVLTSSAYVARREPGEALRILEEDPRELIETILRNIFADGDERLLQRKVYFDNLGREAAAKIRAEMRREGERFLQRINRLLARYDRDRNPRAQVASGTYAGVGVYYFEAEPPPAPPKAPAPKRARKRTSKEPKR